MQNEAHVIRHELNLCVGSPITVACGVSDNVSELSQGFKSEMDRDNVSSTENLQSEYRKRARIYDILVDFQTGGNFPVLVKYI